MPTLNFTVDSKLLEELGQRLVPKPSIALAELVKNAYDADAHLVEIEFRPEEELIRVRDDGHGMTLDEFRDFWMRIGTTHKAEGDRVSPYLSRPMTGSKGVGRLAVQLLAKKLRLRTLPIQAESNHIHGIKASVDWDTAVEAGDLTSAKVEYSSFEEEDVDFPFEHGTELNLRCLKHDWQPEDLKELAREIWYLQPPFRRRGDRISERERFEIRLDGADEARREFEDQLTAIMDIQTARLMGHYEGGTVDLVIEFWSRGSPYRTAHYTYHVKDAPHNAGHYVPNDPEIDDEDKNLNRAEFEIRIYTLSGRQPKGLRLDDVRTYMDRFGGVHVYDSGFRLPFYGSAQSDWLRLEYDHAHRIFVSDLLPKEIDEGYRHTARLQFLPTLRRVFGVVRVDTSVEPNLHIAISRDRLIETKAFQDLVYIVRYAFDRYAYDEALRQYENSQKGQQTKSISERLESLEDVLLAYREDIPPNIYEAIASGVEQVVSIAHSEQEEKLAQLSLLGPLATAGVSAIAIQHELRKQFGWLESLISRLRSIKTGDEALVGELNLVSGGLEDWLQRARATNAIFDYMTGETLERHQRYRAHIVIADVLRQLTFLARGIDIDQEDIDASLYLPEASYAEWAAIFQNVFTNAFNAMRETHRRQVKINTRRSGTKRVILVQDTGSGIDLERADELFEPFQHGIDTPSDYALMGYGGTGLGLTIVKLLAERIGCRVMFVEPEQEFSTAFKLEWQEDAGR